MPSVDYFVLIIFPFFAKRCLCLMHMLTTVVVGVTEFRSPERSESCPMVYAEIGGKGGAVVGAKLPRACCGEAM